MMKRRFSRPEEVVRASKKVLLHLLRNDLVINKKVHFKFYILLLETEKTRARG